MNSRQARFQVGMVTNLMEDTIADSPGVPIDALVDAYCERGWAINVVRTSLWNIVSERRARIVCPGNKLFAQKDVDD